MLKSIVIGMGVLIVMGVAFLVYTISTGLHKTYKLGKLGQTNVPESSVSLTQSAMKPFVDRRFSSIPDYNLDDVSVDSGHVIARYRHENQNAVMLVLFSLQGQRLGSLVFAD